MHAPVGEDPFRMPWIAGQIALGELGPEPRRLHQLRGSDMIGVGIDSVGREEPTGTHAADHSGQRRAGGESRPQPPIGQAEILAPPEPERRCCSGSLSGPRFQRPPRRRFAIGEIKHPHPQPLRLHQRDGAPHADFGVIRVRRDYENVEHGQGLRGERSWATADCPVGPATAYSPACRRTRMTALRRNSFSMTSAPMHGRPPCWRRWSRCWAGTSRR